MGADLRRPRLPVGPLLHGLTTAGISEAELRRRTGIDLARPKRVGTISWYLADRAAIAIGRHPNDVWGDTWWDLDRAEVDDGETSIGPWETGTGSANLTDVVPQHESDPRGVASARGSWPTPHGGVSNAR